MGTVGRFHIWDRVAEVAISFSPSSSFAAHRPGHDGETLPKWATEFRSCFQQVMIALLCLTGRIAKMAATVWNRLAAPHVGARS